MAFDSGDALNDGLKKGDVQGLVIQNPFRMGYLGVMTAVKVIHGEKVPAQVDTGVGLVTPENMNEPAMADLLNPPIADYKE